MLDFNVTLKIVKGSYSYEEEYDLTMYSDGEILQDMQEGIDEQSENEDEAIIVSIEDLKIVDIDFPSNFITDGMELSELIDIAINYMDCDNEDEISIVMEYREEIDNRISATDILDRYIGQYDDMEDFARQDFSESYEIPDHLEPYIDWELVARDYKYDFSITDSGYVFSR